MRRAAPPRAGRAGATLLAFLAAWGASHAAARPVSDEAPAVAAHADRGRVELGEPFQLTIAVIRPKEMAIDLPQALPLGDVFGELARKETVEPLPSGLVRESFALTLAAYAVGAQTVPPLTVRYVAHGESRTVATEAIPIEVVSAVGQQKEELRPIAPPISVEERDLGALWVALGALGGAVALFAAWLAARALRRRRPAAASVRPDEERPVDEVALEALAALRSSALLDADDRRPFVFAVTEVVRAYLGRRFGIDALELTTSELLAALAPAPGAADVQGELTAFFGVCDLVKYAKVPATREEALAALERAVGIVERTRPVVPMPAAAEAGAADGPGPGPEEASRAG